MVIASAVGCQLRLGASADAGQRHQRTLLVPSVLHDLKALLQQGTCKPIVISINRHQQMLPCGAHAG